SEATLAKSQLNTEGQKTMSEVLVWGSKGTKIGPFLRVVFFSAMGRLACLGADNGSPETVRPSCKLRILPRPPENASSAPPPRSGNRQQPVKQPLRKTEIDHKPRHINKGRDEGTGTNRRVHPDAFEKKRQHR